MVSGKYSALTGAITRQQSIDNTAANLANVTTAGYKKKRMSFAAIFEGQRQINSTKGINYNRVQGNYDIYSQGPLKETGNTFHVALNGKGFFKIRSNAGDFLTRRGDFALGDDGRLLTDTGKSVLDTGDAEIFIPPDNSGNVVIDKAGRIFTMNEEGESTQIAQLSVVDVNNPAGLKKENDTAYTLPAGVVENPAQDFSVLQGSIEVSNVNMTEEMTRMIRDNRLFQTYHNVLESYSTLGEKTGELGSLT